MGESRAVLAKLDEASLNGYFEAVYKAFQESERTAGGLTGRRFRIADATVLVRSTDRELLSLMTMALAHLRVDGPGPVDLTIHLWESASTCGVTPLSPLAWYARQQGGGRMSLDTIRFDARGEQAAFNRGSIRTSFHVFPSLLHVFDTKRNLGLCWIDDVANLPYYETASPLRKIFSWWISERGCLFVHGAAVGYENGGVLLVGNAGSGKSTSALACLDAGLLYAGDDYCGVASRPVPYVYSLYNTAKLKSRADLARFPSLAPLVRNASRLDQQKALLFIHPHFGDRLAFGFPLRAILISEVTGVNPARLRSVSPENGLRAMSPSTIQQLPGSGRSAFREMACLVRVLPTYVLETGPDIATIPVAIRRFLLEEACGTNPVR